MPQAEGGSLNASPTAECPPLSLRDISPRWRGGRGDRIFSTSPPIPSPPAVRWGEMPPAYAGAGSGRGGLPQRFANR